MGLCNSRELPSETGQRFKRIPDKYESLEEVSHALRQEGLEGCQLILGVDFTKSNTWTGKYTFNGLPVASLSSFKMPLFVQGGVSTPPMGQ